MSKSVRPQARPRADARLARVVLDGEALTRLSPLQEADRAQAVADLQVENRFEPQQTQADGPYALHLSIHDGRLVFDVRSENDAPLCVVALALGPFRGLIKDYQMLVDSYTLASRKAARRASRQSTWAAADCTTKVRS